jgi:AP-3 complex subunit beta
LQYLLAPHWMRFIVCASDSAQVKAEKIRLLKLLASSENYQALLREFTVRPSLSFAAP